MDTRLFVQTVEKLGAARGHVATARQRLTTRAGYTFTQAEIDYLAEQLSQAHENLARAVDLLVESQVPA